MIDGIDRRDAARAVRDRRCDWRGRSARASLADDVVERVLESIFDGIADLIAYHPRAAQISLAKAYRLEDGLTIDLHPAAKRFFERRRGI